MTPTEMLPDVQTQRALLERHRDQYKVAGYEAFLQAEAMKAQKFDATGQGVPKAKAIEQAETESRNAYASAKRMQELIDALPEDSAPGE